MPFYIIPRLNLAPGSSAFVLELYSVGKMASM